MRPTIKTEGLTMSEAIRGKNIARYLVVWREPHPYHYDSLTFTSRREAEQFMRDTKNSDSESSLFRITLRGPL